MTWPEICRAEWSILRRASLIWLGSLVFIRSLAQQADSSRNISHLSGSLTLTNNGISLIPTFSLNKPAAIFDLSARKGRWSFDPELSFSLKGVPWTFLFWGRYQILSSHRLSLHTGAHLGLSFQTLPMTLSGVPVTSTLERRYLAGELVPDYRLGKHLSIGIYYLYSRGLDPGTNHNTHFLTFHTDITGISLRKNFLLQFTPQVYYLNIDGAEGYYFTSQLTLSERRLPLAASVFFNQALKTRIMAGPEFVWNASLTWSFRKKFVPLHPTTRVAGLPADP